LEWLNHDEIAVSGSVNPSLTETVVLNIKKRTYQGGIFDDGPGADFSPDGKHIAYTSGSPHFTPENRREPALNVDHERVFPKEGTRIRFVSDRRWSPDSSRLAVISEDFVTNRRSVVVWREDGSVSIIALGLPTKTKTDLFWNGGDLMITYDGGSLRIAPTTATLEKSFSKAINPLQQAQSERNRLREVVKNHASRDVDFWCQACPLNVLPRRVPTEYE
jgi:hypothetical protein